MRSFAPSLPITRRCNTAKSLTTAIQSSQAQGLAAFAADLQTVKLPTNKKDWQAWQSARQQLLTIFRAHFPAAETEAEAKEVERYLDSTALLLRCLKNAYVSARAAIEDRLLRSPAPSA